MPMFAKCRVAAAVAVLAALVAAGSAEAYNWRAEPAWISNAGVYRQHELVYQDYLYDDHGANTDGLDRMDLPFGAAGPNTQSPTDPRLSPAPPINWAGDFTYPSPTARTSTMSPTSRSCASRRTGRPSTTASGSAT